MTARRRTARTQEPRNPGTSEPRGGGWEALRAFVSGYLHEDFVAEHKTPEGALRAFLRDASTDERRHLEQDAAGFLARVESWRWVDARSSFQTLGGAWAPPTRTAMSEFLSKIAASSQRRAKRHSARSER